MAVLFRRRDLEPRKLNGDFSAESGLDPISYKACTFQSKQGKQSVLIAHPVPVALFIILKDGSSVLQDSKLPSVGERNKARF